MREFVRHVTVALSIACLTSAIAIVTADSALAQSAQTPSGEMAPTPQAEPPPAQQPTAVRQVALTDKHIDGVLAAQKEMDAITEKLPENARPDPNITAQLEAVARKNGFASYDEYNTIVDNISMVLAGFDPATKKYVGVEAVIKSQIAEVQADKKMPPRDKKEALADLNDALKSPAPQIENKGNIELVAKYYDKLADALGNDEQ